MGDLIPLPTYKGSEETYADIPAKTVLQAAIDAGVDEVLVLGWTGRDTFYSASSTTNIGHNLHLLERAKELIMQRD